MHEQGVRVLPEVEEFMQSREGMGQTCVLVGISGSVVAALAVSDPLKPEAIGVVAGLQQQVRSCCCCCSVAILVPRLMASCCTGCSCCC